MPRQLQRSAPPLSKPAMASSQEGRRLSSGAKCLFKGRGRATLTVLGYRNWKGFLKCNERELTSEEIADVEKAADYENFSVEGVVRVEWPEVTLDFRMDRFLGECSSLYRSPWGQHFLATISRWLL